jgi:hypothetical protein
MACPRVSKRKPDKAVKNFFMVVFFSKLRQSRAPSGSLPSLAFILGA